MANFAFTNILPKCGDQIGRALIRRRWSSTAFVTVSRTQFQASSGIDANAFGTVSKAAKHGANEVKKVGEDVMNKAAAANEHVAQKAKEVANDTSNAAEDLTEKAKKTVQDAWGSVKDTTENVKDSVVGQAEEGTKEFVKENAKSVEKAMNTKD